MRPQVGHPLLTALGQGSIQRAQTQTFKDFALNHRHRPLALGTLGLWGVSVGIQNSEGRWQEEGCILHKGGAWGFKPNIPWSPTGLASMGSLPGISNEPPGMRQETASGHTLRVRPLSPQGIPLWGYQQLGGPACRRQRGSGDSRPGAKSGRRTLWVQCSLAKCGYSHSQAQVLLSDARALVGLPWWPGG